MPSLWNRSGIIERHGDDVRAAGALAYFFDGGTTTPMTVFQDAGESTPHAHPVVADANGRWPDVFIPYVTAYDVQVKDANGVQITYSQRIPNPDPVELAVTIDPGATTLQTGHVHFEFSDSPKTGFVRANGGLIGNAASAAVDPSNNERNNADCEDLFIYLWDNMSTNTSFVLPSRGASGAADFAANKVIFLPDLRGATVFGTDSMGAPSGNTSYWTGFTFDIGSGTEIGSRTGGPSEGAIGRVDAGSQLNLASQGMLGTWYIKL